jgi:hypothetical protein
VFFVIDLTDEQKLAKYMYEMWADKPIFATEEGHGFIKAAALARMIISRVKKLDPRIDPQEVIEKLLDEIDPDLTFDEVKDFVLMFLSRYGADTDVGSATEDYYKSLLTDRDMYEEFIKKLSEATDEELAEMGLTREERDRLIEESRRELERIKAELERLQKPRRIHKKEYIPSKPRPPKPVPKPPRMERAKQASLIEWLAKTTPAVKQAEKPAEKPPEKPAEKPAAQPPTQRPSTLARYEAKIKDVMTYEQFINKVVEFLRYAGLIDDVISEVLRINEQELRIDYETVSYQDIEESFNWLASWIAGEYIPANFEIVTVGKLQAMGVRVAHPNPIWIHGLYIRPRIKYLIPRFDSWAEDNRKIGARVEFKPITVRHGVTHLIVDPDVELENLRVAIRGMTIALVSAQAIGYVADSVNRYVEYYYYPMCLMIK